MIDETLLQVVDEIDPIEAYGRVNQIVGLVIESNGPPVAVGELCCIQDKTGNVPIDAEVVGFKDNKVLLMPLGNTDGVQPRSIVRSTNRPFHVDVGENLLGRVLDGLGRPMDGKGRVKSTSRKRVSGMPPSPLKRRRIRESIGTGIRAIDALLTCGKGQRVGIFSGSGVGKSVLLGMIARYSKADVNVIALVGERGKEVLDFLERDLGEEGLSKSVVVVATSDQPGLVRVKAPILATAIAEYFRDLGKDVMLMMDSVTRVAIAQREVGLSVGEPPTTKGYPPSVFAMLPKFLERAGTSHVGSITGFYTVLVEGDDVNEPISDAVRAILDGHIVLSRELASAGHYPAIDVLQSISRVMVDVVTEEHLRATEELRAVLATYRHAEDLIDIGAYVQGSNPRIDFAIDRIDRIQTFLRQGMDERSEFASSLEEMKALLS